MKKNSTGMIILEKNLFNWLDGLRDRFIILGPVPDKKGETIFKPVSDAFSIRLDYQSTMQSPARIIYPSRQTICEIDRKSLQTTAADDRRKRIIFGLHPCDMHAISILDRTLSWETQDFYYKQTRENTITVVLNCNLACKKKYPAFTHQGFCSSMGTGPFLKKKAGSDIELTLLSGSEESESLYLMEFRSETGLELASGIRRAEKAGAADQKAKLRLEKKALSTFSKKLDIDGLAELLKNYLDHKVYKNTADARCLSCTNCTMVCPTCFCYNIEECTGMDLKKTTRIRHWDSCLELNFAKVHGFNFRDSRSARLRQFVTHKLSSWVEQFGCFGCVGCGRCMTWCPTHIDLTEIVAEIRRDDE
ncbi:MAG: 4Fe-4S dicluster domain-containing protein [Candidatus Wallbacteria bacterium]|nr:4Fe-4S dicluster domain-containing protein [Candidatus Wallbacteria bacterium]